MKTFTYTANLKLKVEDPPLEALQDKLPGITDLIFKSREFSDYTECVQSCKKLLDDFTKRASAPPGALQIGTEINPKVSGEPTISKDWSPTEIARLWVIDKTTEQTTTIFALAQARIFSDTNLTLHAN